MRSCSRRSFNCWPARAPSVSGLREPAFLERLRGLADVLAALLDLLARLGHPLLVLLVLHPLAQLVGVAEDLLLLVAESLELALDLRAGLGVLAASRADWSSLSRSFRSLCRWASSRSRLSTCRFSRLLALALGLVPAGIARCAAPRSGSRRATIRAAGAAAASCSLELRLLRLCCELLRMTWNSRARSLSRAW